MLLILRKFDLGGIQTLFVKIANALAMDGRDVALLSLASEKYADKSLLANLHPDVKVIFVEDYLGSPLCVKKFYLLRRVSKKLTGIIRSYAHIHVTDMYSILFLSRVGINTNQVLTLGVYHPNEIYHRFSATWFHYKFDVSIFKEFRSSNIFLFNTSNLEKHQQLKEDLGDNNVFPIGVLSDDQINAPVKARDQITRVLMLGRMAPNKLYFLGVVKIIEELLSTGYDCELTIVGTGPLRKLVEAQVVKSEARCKIIMLERVEHDELSAFSSKFDIVLASGTTLIECVASGCIGISAVESSRDCTNGYLSRIWKREYSLNLLPGNQKTTKLLLDTIRLSDDMWSARQKTEFETAYMFRITEMIYNMNSNVEKGAIREISIFTCFMYEVSRAFFGLLSSLKLIKAADKYIK